MSARPDERGAATVFAVSCLALLLLLGAALGVVTALVAAHRAAQGAADLAALAGAETLGRGRDPCTAAAATAASNGGALAACEVDDRDVVVEVRVEGPHWLGQSADPVARARAGPAAR
ncbi:Rv3654c family TadE-like protein [Nocardioides sp. cx-173]|uniref:Rv3654c family TadE-like protein n=1 Tax=Nocardioides sp. cx-173 TaxID=2898796 RepID=UPI001E5F5C6E|nr:Rv3654c family TadE-like protein [Nocardioides sp. cx-173]MCD4523393.1 pilus assembly protein TadG-related protein [Nocardioides sp. cx-173]UGB42268.1 pilus assembly protein TadG-related protein [Nocardioides sp. cx-173]